jgi:hypothetical protein
MACHHILEAIAEYADAGTQATLLRVNKTFFRIAGKVLYADLRVSGGASAWKMFRGALIGLPVHSVELFRHLHRCRPSPRSCTVVKALSLNTTDRAPHSRDPLTAIMWNRYTPLEHNTLVSGIFRLDQFIGLVDGADEPHTSNFKAPLLKYTRVLTLGAHERCFCGAWGPFLANLLPNVEVLVVPAANSSELHLCDPRACQLLAVLPSVKSLMFHMVDPHH